MNVLKSRPMTKEKTNFRRLIAVRSQYGKWKSYDITFDNETHWDRWVNKMWGWGYKLESVYDYINCKVCTKQHLKGSCGVECSQCQKDMQDNVITRIDGMTMCAECYANKLNN